MVRICTVCKLNKDKFKALNQEGKFILHLFPINRDEELLQKWLDFAKMKKEDIINKLICSEHFLDNDYDSYTCTNLDLRYELKRTAVPTVMKITSSSCAPLKNILTKTPLKQDERFILEAEIKRINQLHLSCFDKQSTTIEQLKIKNKDQDAEIRRLMKAYSTMEATLEYERKSNSLKINEMIQKIQHLNMKLEESRMMSRKSIQNKEEVTKDLIQKNPSLFSQLQMDLLTNKIKRVKQWNKEDIAKGFTMRLFGDKAYKFVKNGLKYPLPSKTALRKYAGKIDLVEGLLTDMIEMMSWSGQNLSEMDKITILQYDEMAVTNVYEISKDRIVGPHKKVLIVQARGLFRPWKQVVFMKFDQNLVSQSLMEILTALHNIGFIVKGITSDNATENTSLWKRLQVDENKPFFFHPVTNNKIYVFSDVPHLMKLIRNHVLDDIILWDNIEIDSSLLIDLVNQNNNIELSSVHYLRKEHIELSSLQRQNVKLAVQLLSRQTAVAVRRLNENNDKSSKLSEFILIINNWFDVLNSNSVSESQRLKSPYGKNLLEQNGALIVAYELFKNMRCINKFTRKVKDMLPFQKGCLISTNALKMMYNDLKTTYDNDFKYILCHRLNNDALENLFSQIRTKGIDDSPTPLAFVARLKLIILGKNTAGLKSQKNTNACIEPDNNDNLNYIFVKAIQTVRNEELHNTETASSSSDLEIEEDQLIVHQCEDDGFEYMVGWIAMKLHREFPYMGDYTYKLANQQPFSQPLNNNCGENSFVDELSLGGLTKPNQRWLQEAQFLEKMFLSYHGETFRKMKNNIRFRPPISSLAKKLYQKIGIYGFDKKIIDSYVKYRVYFRIKYLNKRLLIQKREKAASTKAVRASKAQKKLAKITGNIFHKQK